MTTGFETTPPTDNREIYRRSFPPERLRPQTASAYDRRMVGLRLSLIERFGRGRDVLDLCCGTGAYLLPRLERVRSAIAVDVSEAMLKELAGRLNGPSRSVAILQADAVDLPLRDECVDFVFSYASLYYVREVGRAIEEIARVLRGGGHAAIELGNRLSLNTIVSRVQHRDRGWPRPEHISCRAMEKLLQGSGLTILERRAFQLLPMYGPPRRLALLYPLLASGWKKLFGIELFGKVLDEWVSGSWPLRHLAFRHLFVVCKR